MHALVISCQLYYYTLLQVILLSQRHLPCSQCVVPFIFSVFPTVSCNTDSFSHPLHLMVKPLLCFFIYCRQGLAGQPESRRCLIPVSMVNNAKVSSRCEIQTQIIRYLVHTLNKYNTFRIYIIQHVLTGLLSFCRQLELR